MPHKPSWFKEGQVLVSNAATCGLARGGRMLAKIDPATGARLQVSDPDTGGNIDLINDQLLADVEALREGRLTETLAYIPSEEVTLRSAVPTYYNRRYEAEFEAAMAEPRFDDFRTASLAELRREGLIEITSGHGSPPNDQRVGDVPYIKVSDLRAGLVNVNPTNRVPRPVAEKYWGGNNSGLRSFDLLSPERTSKNIGDFCILLPGQEQVLLTKEILVFRPGRKAEFDAFYLLWAMTLRIVREQWKRVVFMQTNREDVGERYLEIKIPVPSSREIGDNASEAFRIYFKALANARSEFSGYLAQGSEHHFFVSGVEPPEVDEADEAITLGEVEAIGFAERG